MISGLTRSTGECWASNEYLGDLLGISKQTVSRCISELKDAGHISSIVQDDYRRTITLSYVRASQKCVGDSQKRLGGYSKMTRGIVKNEEGDSQKCVDNNINELDKDIYITKNPTLSMSRTIPAILTFIRKQEIPQDIKKDIEIKVMACAKHPHTIYEIHELVDSSLPKNNNTQGKTSIIDEIIKEQGVIK